MEELCLFFWNYAEEESRSLSSVLSCYVTGRGTRSRWASAACLLLVAVRERTIPTERPPLVDKVITNFFVERGCRVVSVTDPCGRILVFLDRSRFFSLQVAPQLYARGSVDPFPDPLLLRKSGSAGTRARTSGSVARNCDQWTTEAVEPRNTTVNTFLELSKQPEGNSGS
jgi:hypothetical protein